MLNQLIKNGAKFRTQSGISGLEAAQRIIRTGGLKEMAIHQVPGQLTDHYDPRKTELSLSANVYQGSSVASMAITAHELGHAQQDQEGYFLLRLRSMLVPAVNIGSTLGWILIMVGLVLNVIGIAWLGVFAFSGGAIFALATLPVELNASSRAKVLIEKQRHYHFTRGRTGSEPGVERSCADVCSISIHCSDAASLLVSIDRWRKKKT